MFKNSCHTKLCLNYWHPSFVYKVINKYVNIPGSKQSMGFTRCKKVTCHDVIKIQKMNYEEFIIYNIRVSYLSSVNCKIRDRLTCNPVNYFILLTH